MRNWKAAVTLVAALVPQFASASSCKDAIEVALTKAAGPDRAFHVVQTTNITPVGGEGVVEVVELVRAEDHHAIGRNDYYYLVTATCTPMKGFSNLSDLASLDLWDDMPGQGGVQVKTVARALL